MEREIDKKNLVLKEDESIGTVQIADDVVAMIASLATTEVDGVSAMAGNITNELMSKVGVKNLTKGVKVEVQDKNVTVDLAVTMEYGYNIPAGGIPYDIHDEQQRQYCCIFSVVFQIGPPHNLPGDYSTRFFH